MDAKELSSLYGRMVASCRKEEHDAERGVWKEVLGDFSAAELDSACRRWKSDTTIEEWSERPRGARMPDAAELRASILQFRSANANKFIPCGECEEGWVRVHNGQTAGVDGRKNLVDKKIGAVKPCDCRNRYVASRRSA